MRTLELLAPAKNLECGMAAIDHGADAVYIGAAQHGARAAAGNSIEDIARLCEYAHRFGVGVHATMNTIIYDEEMDGALALAADLATAGVDAILVQDMGLLRKLTLPGEHVAEVLQRKRVALHASTQCDTRTAEKVAWLVKQGVSRVVLARELSLQEMAAIHRVVPAAELEAFVHGALCVSYSGLCYVSQHCFGRSANRGECAQFCRMKFDLVDAHGKVIEHDSHLLSLKDMSQIENMEKMADVGISSFKIEGRLKDIHYVKNVVSAYSCRLDEIVARRPDLYRRASAGNTEHYFKPDLARTFNRGYTNYFLEGRQQNIASFHTPKALGAEVGRVKDCGERWMTVSGGTKFANGDGLCFINEAGKLEGFRVNRVSEHRLYPFRMPNIRVGTVLYRNNDVEFEKILAGKTAWRSIPLRLEYDVTEEGFILRLSVVQAGWECMTEAVVLAPHEQSRSDQTENVKRQLLKLGETAFHAEEIVVSEQAAQYFLPNSRLAVLRREGVEALEQAWKEYVQSKRKVPKPMPDKPMVLWQSAYAKHPYLYNISNEEAATFYRSQGMESPSPAFELEQTHREPLVMQCRHCIRYSLGFCVRHGGKQPQWKEPLRLRLGDGRMFRLEFECKECQMNVYAE